MRTRVKLRENQLDASNFVKRLNSWRRQLRAPLDKKIIRGHGYIMSSFMEDLFAQYLEKILDDAVDLILIDMAINLNGKVVRPDIILIKNHTIIGFFDCKISLWNRGNVTQMATTYMEYLHKIRNSGKRVRIVSTSFNDSVIGNSEEQKEYLVDDSACWDVIVAHVWGNSDKGKVMEQINTWNSDSEHSETRIWHMVNLYR